MKLAEIICIIIAAVLCFMIVGGCDPGYGYVELSISTGFLYRTGRSICCVVWNS